eukprot:CAMPEP_0172363502 /NCGR_PEP_ID=MMETSP1060-20121228/6846_1 /TAXON_ID=37318 /ORGANISM="Pseudo-nitzschia pungens, Strain cf. cingulata" /LENGTH=1179 /DNA_ID=CAMNT_0013086253 /DNA_START=103 /DNA_END=3642 /DNA_ORIENTATION=-
MGEVDARERAIHEAKLEQLLSEKLMQGYVLMEASCPKCATPLVKNHQMVPKTLLNPSTDENDSKKVDKSVLVPQESFDQPFRPVDGVPMCVACNSHVITHGTEVSILEHCDSMKDKGSIYVALEEAASDLREEPEIINLANVEDKPNGFQDNDFTSDHPEVNLSFTVGIDASVDCEGNDNFELTFSPKNDDESKSMTFSPREGDAAKPIVLEEDAPTPMIGEGEGYEGKPINLVEEDPEESYAARREIATKVLGAKMLQGYTLQEKTCDTCGMPVMKYKGRVDCVVCPAMEKKAKKKLRQKQRMEEKQRMEKEEGKQRTEEDKTCLETEVLETEVEETEPPQPPNDIEELQNQREQLEHIQTVRKEIEEKALREEEESIKRAKERQRAIEEEKARILALEKQEEEKRIAEEKEKQAEFARKLEDFERERQRQQAALVEQKKAELARLEAIAKEEEAKRRFLEEQRKKEEEIAAREAQKKAIQESETKALAVELKRIKGLDEKALLNDKALAMKRDLMVEEYRKRMAEKAALDAEVALLEEERVNEEMEARRRKDEQRAEAEGRMIAALEADAAVKALAAEEAIRRAKDALGDVQTRKQEILAEAIEAAEKEAIAETEQTIKAECEDYVEPVILQTDSDIEKERWEILRLEGRAIMTRRVLQGWELLPESCKGSECFSSPLVGRGGQRECCVCGGAGSGTDGAYAKVDEEDQAIPTSPPETSKEEKAKAEVEAEVCGDGCDGEEDWLTSGQDEEFEKKRAIYSKEIGKRMLLGWILIDASCPKCIMPLMMDDHGNTDLCVVCGEVKPFDGSTIATKDMAALETTDVEEMEEIIEEPVEDPVEEHVEEHVVAETSEAEEPKAPVEAETSVPDIERVDSDLCSAIQKQAMKQQKKREPVVSNDPPALKTEARVVVEKKVQEIAPRKEEENVTKNVISLPTNDFADSAAAIQQTVRDEGRDDIQPVDFSVEMIANMFLKSPHGYNFQNVGKSMDVDEVKELVDVFLVTNVDSEVSDDFKVSVAERILVKITTMAVSKKVTTPLRIDASRKPENRFCFEDAETKSTSKNGRRPKPRPEDNVRRLPPKSPGPRTTPRGMSRKNTIIEGGPMNDIRRSRSDDTMSAVSRASSVASDALESIYDRIEFCKQKLLDPNNSLDEQIATASLLERLAQAAVSVKEMEDFD